MAKGLLSQNTRTLEKARTVVQMVIDGLKSTSLLLRGNNENNVRIHVIVRHIAIACAEKAFLVDHGAL